MAAATAQAGEYREHKELADDFGLLCRNAIVFNTKLDNPFRLAAKQLHADGYPADPTALPLGRLPLIRLMVSPRILASVCVAALALPTPCDWWFIQQRGRAMGPRSFAWGRSMPSWSTASLPPLAGGAGNKRRERKAACGGPNTRARKNRGRPARTHVRT